MKVVDWGFNPQWLEYVERSWPGGARVLRTVDDDPARLSFEAKCAEEFGEFSQIKTFISVQEPKEGSGYDTGFPHIHAPLDGISLVHYLQTGDNPAPLHIFDGENGKVVEELIPEVGKTVIIPNNVWHGVPLHKGSINRIQMVAIAFP